MQVNTQALTNQITQQLKALYPQNFQQLQQMRQTLSPEGLLQQTIGKMNPQARQQLFDRAKQCGFPEDILTNMQNMLTK